MKFNLFLKLDEFFFQKIDLLKTEGVFQKFDDLTANLNESQQKIIVQVITFTLVLLPYAFVAVLWWENFQTKKNLDIKKQIIDQIAMFDGNKGTLNNLSSNYLAPSPINSQVDLDNKIRNIMSQNSINTQKVSIEKFNTSSSSTNMTKIEADLKFMDFGTADFSNFVRGMIESDKFKITKISLDKKVETSLLQGTISIMHMGQNTPQFEQ